MLCSYYKSIVHEPAASASPGRWLEVQNQRSHPTPIKSESAFNRTPTVFLCLSQFEKHWIDYVSRAMTMGHVLHQACVVVGRRESLLLRTDTSSLSSIDRYLKPVKEKEKEKTLCISMGKFHEK